MQLNQFHQMKISKRKVNDWLLSQGVLWISCEGEDRTILTGGGRGVIALTRTVSGEKQIYSGNLEILPGIGKPGKCFRKYEIFSGH